LTVCIKVAGLTTIVHRPLQSFVSKAIFIAHSTNRLQNLNIIIIQHRLNNMKSQKIIFGILLTVIASMMMMMVYMTSTVTLATAQHATSMKSTVVRDSATILLQDKTIPAKGFIHLYDTTPYMI
jgi:hypothetical protein